MMEDNRNICVIKINVVLLDFNYTYIVFLHVLWGLNRFIDSLDSIDAGRKIQTGSGGGPMVG